MGFGEEGEEKGGWGRRGVPMSWKPQVTSHSPLPGHQSPHTILSHKSQVTSHKPQGGGGDGVVPMSWKSQVPSMQGTNSRMENPIKLRGAVVLVPSDTPECPTGHETSRGAKRVRPNVQRALVPRD